MSLAAPYVARRNLLGSSAVSTALAILGAGSASWALATGSGPAGSNARRMEELMTTGATNDLNVTHHTVEINGILMHYITAGSGEPVVLVLGFPET